MQLCILFIKHMYVFSCSVKSLAKKKLGINEEQDVILFTEEDGTECDEETFDAFNAGTTFVCAFENQNWLPRSATASSIEVKTIEKSDAVASDSGTATVTQSQFAKVGAYKFKLRF